MTLVSPNVTLPVRISRLDDSLAHGLAKQEVTLLGEMATRDRARFYDVLDSPRFDRPLSGSRMSQLIDRVSPILHAMNMCGYILPTHVGGRPKTAIWHLPVGSKREGFVVSRLQMDLSKRRAPEVHERPVIVVTSHAIARLYQRHQVMEPQDFIELFRPLVFWTGVIRLLANYCHHHQWAIPIGDNAAVVGTVDCLTNEQMAMTGVQWAITATTFIEPVGSRWRNYLTRWEAGVEAALAEDDLFADTALLRLDADGSRTTGTRLLVEHMSDPSLDWARTSR